MKDHLISDALVMNSQSQPQPIGLPTEQQSVKWTLKRHSSSRGILEKNKIKKEKELFENGIGSFFL
jgi:hypothetical protein